ncbi:MAG: HD-GYP domain-containing protein, partial [Anaerolineae bacterium]|nr:HD-GYP domain-containing protein [Anaerolineae bacterium]
RDEETQGHSGRVTDLATQLASRMGYTEEQLVHFRRGVILHDIGKMGIPDNILLKPGPLDEDEWRIMRQHPLLAYNWLKDIHHLEKAIDVPYAHHERWNGSGYPRGLKGTEIPLSARIFAVVDVFDALISRRPYRMALPVYEAINFLRQNSGVLFDPEVVDLFLQMMEEPNDPIKPIARVDQAYNSQ